MAADNSSEMECPSPDVGDSRKRPLDTDIDSNLIKRSHFSGEGSSTFHFKTLIPSVAAGAIIGKGGETIATLQKETGARVKMSKSHDFYPGTTERICLVTGSTESIISVVDFIIDKIKEKPEVTKSPLDIELKNSSEREKQVKILVPNSTAGMVIGKAGAFIKQIKEESGSYIQISQKPKDLALQERCITIVGEKENNKLACRMILSKIVEDPLSGTCTNVSYADVNGPVANFNPTGSPYATPPSNFNSSTASLSSSITNTTTSPNLLMNGAGLHLNINIGSSLTSPNTTFNSNILDHIKVIMRNSGYAENVIVEVSAALGILAKYNILGTGIVANPNSSVNCFNISGLDQTSSNSSNNNVLGALGQINLDSYLSTVSPTTGASIENMDIFRHTSLPNHAITLSNNNNYPIGNNSSVQSMPNINKAIVTTDLVSKEKNVEIPEVIVGAILGPGGRSLVEIQHVSGANIQISKKGTFAPGTRNRIVTISGQPSAISMAHYLIEQRISEEEMKRACQMKLSSNVIQ